MPIYEYACQKCGNEFELLVRGQDRAACPKCKSAELERRSAGTRSRATKT
jgi:putative FmdB family regulatory protein